MEVSGIKDTLPGLKDNKKFYGKFFMQIYIYTP